MSSSMELTEKESFDNYLSYKDELEYKFSLEMGCNDVLAIDLAVIKELYTRDLINYEFYMRQCETIKTVHKYNDNDNQTSSLTCLFEFALFISLIIGIVVLSKYRFSAFPTNVLPFMDEL